MTVDKIKLSEACRLILDAIGEDEDREGLVGTPNRFARMWEEFVDYDPGNLETTFEAVTTDQMVIVRAIRVWSICEHHLLPFFCDISIGYIAREKVLGLSKLARVAHKYAHELQLQERLVDDIATEISSLAGTEHVAVLGRGVHLCMVMRGIKSPGEMITSAMFGCFRNESEARHEFLSLVGGQSERFNF